MFRSAPWLAVAAALLTPAVAHADSISLSSGDIGKAFTLNYDGFAGGGTIAGLTGSTTFTLTGTTANSYTFSYLVNNTSSSPITTSRISGFGFNTNPDIGSATATGVFNTVGTGNAPNIGTVDVCFKGGGGTNNCAGGGGNGVDLGNSGSGSLTLNFASALSSLSLSDFFVRYQSITGAGATTSAVGSGTLTGSTGGSSGGTPVPEPEMLLLFGIAAGGVAWARRRRATAPRLAIA